MYGAMERVVGCSILPSFFLHVTEKNQSSQVYLKQKIYLTHLVV
jgi:hypothetical protein